jgi:hypothetical protein
MRSRELLARLLAWRIQADAFGGLDAATVRLLETRQLPAPQPQLHAGIRLSREWLGKRHDVEVLENGFRYGDREYRSLSEVARTITGSRWNGPRFFGLRSART